MHFYQYYYIKTSNNSYCFKVAVADGKIVDEH